MKDTRVNFEKDFTQIFKNKDGKVVIVQKPSALIYAALIFYLIRFLPISGITKISFWGVSITMLYWSFLEVMSGESIFRRILGFGVAVYFLVKIATRLMVL